MDFHKVSVPFQDQSEIPPGPTDHTSLEILNLFHPAYAKSVRPLSTLGDGNCMYRALSLALCGTQNFHKQIRLLTAIEIITQKDFYTPNTDNSLSFLKDYRIITSDYSTLVYDSATLTVYSEMAHIYAASAALGITIRSYYPPQLIPECSSEAYTRTVVGRGVKQSSPQVCLMWTNTSVPKQLDNFMANHFVPLLHTARREEPGNIGVRGRKDPLLPTIIHVSSDEESDCPVVSETGSEQDVPRKQISSVGTDVSESESNSSSADSESNTSAAGTPLESGRFLDRNKVVNLLLTSENGIDKVPVGRKENTYFIVNNQTNISNRKNNVKSVFSDDCGVWNASTGASPKSYYLKDKNGNLKSTYFYKGQFCTLSRVKVKNGFKRHYEPLNPQPNADSVVVVHRYYTTLKQDASYKKRVSWLGGGGGNCPLAVIEYLGTFPGLAPHGNSKHNASEYVRTPDYVMKEIHSLNQSCKPQKVYSTLKEKYDEVSRPTGLQQIRDKKKNAKSSNRGECTGTNVADHIQRLENMVTNNHPFVRSTIRISGKTPFIILYDDQQIEDLKNICCSGQSVLGVDKTYNLCEMHVTVTCYKQVSVTNPRTGNAPVFLGPVLIHDSSTFEAYCLFLQHLQLKMLGADFTKLVIGTDDETALVNAIQHVFPASTHVLCTRHLKENVSRKLKDDALSRKDQTAILQKIFDKGGILDADDPVCFEEKCDALVAFCDGTPCKFSQYFNGRLRGLLKKKVNEPMRRDLIHEDWTNNNCESINHVLKQLIDWRAKSLTVLVKTVQEHVVGQFGELRSAMVGSGNYRLADNFTHFFVSKTEWVEKSVEQRNRLYRKFRAFIPGRDHLLLSTDGCNEIVAPKTRGKKPCQRKRQINERTTTSKKSKQ